MVKKLVDNGNSKAVLMTKDMLEHLGIDEYIEIVYETGQIVLRRPKRLSFEEAKKAVHKKYGKALRNLAK